ncbi:dTDP-4-dehydrorhamnose 3,5-epimerase family protein [Protaetiibacter larvae]|uniref:dTDP-4-dehydrorhamnose 3,5-epimerase family protein n=1 Tax=Protaetiibacter larvae TaxID=2592654 RepID=UPI00143CE428|nr:dTDP-4-dehydrorhamnose 3,5-epimerase family protein [Protaetiibacter larvae]
MTSSAPLPEPVFEDLAFPGTKLVKHRVVAYNNSILVEALREGWSGLYADSIEHLYWIVTHRGVLRDWGQHEYTTDRYSVVYGDIEVALADGREDSPTHGQVIVVPLSAERGEGLLIPPGVWHTFRTTTDTAVLLNAKSPSYNPDNVDKVKKPINNSFGFTWSD